MDPFRGYLKVKIREGKEHTFQSLIPSFVEIVKHTEPNALQFEAFAAEGTRELIWLESYSSKTAFDLHMTNPELEELKLKMMPLQEGILSMYFMSSPTQATLQNLNQFGIQAAILDPWPGTLRLAEATRDDELNIQTFVTLDLSDLDAYRNISEQVENAASTQPGVLFHRSYQIDDNRVAVLEEYKDSNSLIEWAKVFGENSGNFNSLVEGLTCEVFGTPSEPCKEMLNGWGASYFKKVAGFTRF